MGAARMKPARGRSQRDSQTEGLGRASRRTPRAPRQPEEESAEHYDETWDDSPRGDSPGRSWYAEATGGVGRRLLRRGTQPPLPPTEPEDAEWSPIEADWHPGDPDWDASDSAPPYDAPDYPAPEDAIATEPSHPELEYPDQEPLPVYAPAGYAPPVWSWAGYAWRFGKHLTIPRINRLLRLGLQRIIPQSSHARFVMMGIPPEIVEFTLKQVRSIDDWAEAWTGTAQRFLSETRRGGNLLSPQEAARARQRAAMCYHVAPFFALGDDRLARASRSSATTLFNQSVGLLMPNTRRVAVRWRAKSLPGYLTVPEDVEGQVPLVVLLNGLTTAKEELVLWQDAFLQQKMAVLALDWPGTGEATPLGPIRPDVDDIADGLFELVEDEPNLNRDQVVLVGISLGAALAIRAAARDRRIAAVVAVTPPYEPWMWLGAANELVLGQIAMACGGYDKLARYAVELHLPAAVQRLRVPLLILGAGRDLVVPPAEASRMAEAAGDAATLIWYEHAGHALFDALPTWTEDVAGWVGMLFGLVDEGAHLAAEAAPMPAEPAGHALDDDAEPEQSEVLIHRERLDIPPPPSGTDFGPLGPAAARILAEEPTAHRFASDFDEADAPPEANERSADAPVAHPSSSEHRASEWPQPETSREDSARPAGQEHRAAPPDAVTVTSDDDAPLTTIPELDWEPEDEPVSDSVEVLPDLPEEPTGGVRPTGAFAAGRGRSARANHADDDIEPDEATGDPHAPYRPPRRPEP